MQIQYDIMYDMIRLVMGAMFFPCCLIMAFNGIYIGSKAKFADIMDDVAEAISIIILILIYMSYGLISSYISFSFSLENLNDRFYVLADQLILFAKHVIENKIHFNTDTHFEILSGIIAWIILITLVNVISYITTRCVFIICGAIKRKFK